MARSAPVGVSLKTEHFDDVLAHGPDLAFFEIHAENAMIDAGATLTVLERINAQIPLSVHGVGLSLGSAEGLDDAHLKRFKAVVDRFNPVLVSEHLAWSRGNGVYLNDLLPLPLTQESLSVMANNVDRVQQTLGRRILVENPSSYMAFESSTLPEPEFLAMLADRTGCGLLLDVNNIYVSSRNMGTSAETYLDAIPTEAVGEVHLAGHVVKDIEGRELRIDDHGSAVSAPVWDLYERLIEAAGSLPTLVEWDTNIPPFQTLLTEADKARAIMVHHEPRAEKAHG
ncbi:MNIO family bufferin maturase [Yunchengibacter salinarum]|uniref:MNIO family bufferin maturase n=1 Tax=Yunchengibacter salinarum TaxID=3133399 RepID=UPI0035B67A86